MSMQICFILLILITSDAGNRRELESILIQELLTTIHVPYIYM